MEEVTVSEATLEKTSIEAKHRTVDWYIDTARRLYPDLPSGWKWYEILAGHDGQKSEIPPGAIRLIGCVPNGVYKSGKKKGDPRYAHPIEGTSRTVWLKSTDVDETRRLWEAKTGECWKCVGTGQEWAGWSVAAGHRYRDCAGCAATGKSLARAAPDRGES